MSQALFALERRFELRALYMFQAIMTGLTLVALFRFDWKLLGVCILALLLNGVIGRGLHKNREKTFKQLAAGSGDEAEVVDEKPTLQEYKMVGWSAKKFITLAAATAASVMYLLDQSGYVSGMAALYTACFCLALIYWADKGILRFV